MLNHYYNAGFLTMVVASNTQLRTQRALKGVARIERAEAAPSAIANDEKSE